jgi:dynein heavy chain
MSICICRASIFTYICSFILYIFTVNKSCGQLALLGLQVSWTLMCQDALTKATKNKQIMADTNKMQLAVLFDLSSWCLDDLESRMNRVKIETLVTIQVYF